MLRRIIFTIMFLFLISACGSQRTAAPIRAPTQALIQQVITLSPAPSRTAPRATPIVNATTIPTQAPIKPTAKATSRPLATIARPTAMPTVAPPPASGGMRYQDLLNLIGKTLDDPEFLNFATANAGSCSFQGFYYVCKSLGIEMVRTMQGRVNSIFIFAQGADGYDEYQGELPNGLTWRDTRASVEAKMGMPTEAAVVLGKYEATYKPLGLIIAYKSGSTTDLSARLYSIHIQPSIR